MFKIFPSTPPEPGSRFGLLSAAWGVLHSLGRFLPHLCVLFLLIQALPARAEFKPNVTWLRWHKDIHFRADASTVRESDSLVRIDTEAGVADYSDQRIEFSSSLETLEILEAWTQTPDGRRLPVAADKIRTLEATDEGDSTFSDAKVKVIIYPAVTVGAQLYLRYRLTQHTPYFPGKATWASWLQPTLRFEDVRIRFRQDAGVPLQVGSLGMSGGKVSPLPGDDSGTVRHEFTFRQDTAFPPELSRVDLSDFAPYIAATTFKDRLDVAQTYQTHARPKAEPTPEVRKLAAELTAGATTEREKVRRLYNWVSRNIRYVALEIGAGGYIPHAANTILEHRYGDCKDHVVLLEALLRAVGIESSPALVNASRAMKLSALPTFTPFDHVITYIPSLNLYLDATARFAPMGTLPDQVMDKPVLLTASGQEARTPKTSPANNYVHTRTWLQVSDDGSVYGSSVAEVRGAKEVDSRSAQFDNLGKHQEDLARRYLARFGETGTGSIDVHDPLDLDKPWEVRAEFELDPVVNIPGRSAMLVPVGIAPGHLRWLANRRPPSTRRFDYQCFSTGHREETELKLPRSARIDQIPANVRFERGPLRYVATYRKAGQAVLITRELSIDRASHTCNARDDQDWAALLRVLQRDMRGQVFLR